MNDNKFLHLWDKTQRKTAAPKWIYINKLFNWWGPLNIQWSSTRPSALPRDVHTIKRCRNLRSNMGMENRAGHHPPPQTHLCLIYLQHHEWKCKLRKLWRFKILFPKTHLCCIYELVWPRNQSKVSNNNNQNLIPTDILYNIDENLQAKQIQHPKRE